MQIPYYQEPGHTGPGPESDLSLRLGVNFDHPIQALSFSVLPGRDRHTGPVLIDFFKDQTLDRDDKYHDIGVPTPLFSGRQRQFGRVTADDAVAR